MARRRTPLGAGRQRCEAVRRAQGRDGAGRGGGAGRGPQRASAKGPQGTGDFRLPRVTLVHPKAPPEPDKARRVPRRGRVPAREGRRPQSRTRPAAGRAAPRAQPGRTAVGAGWRVAGAAVAATGTGVPTRAWARARPPGALVATSPSVKPGGRRPDRSTLNPRRAGHGDARQPGRAVQRGLGTDRDVHGTGSGHLTAGERRAGWEGRSTRLTLTRVTAVATGGWGASGCRDPLPPQAGGGLTCAHVVTSWVHCGAP